MARWGKYTNMAYETQLQFSLIGPSKVRIRS